jgi:hypothetical protein
MQVKSKPERPKAASFASNAEYLEEDGWIFRVRPGIPVECVRRVAEVRFGETVPAEQVQHR